MVGGLTRPYDLYLLVVLGMIKMADWSSSLRLKRLLARAVAAAAFQLSRRKRRIREEALSQIVSQSNGQTRSLVKQSFYEFWYDTFCLWPSTAERNGITGAEIRGLWRLESALARGKGVILWESSFFGRREIAKRILHEHSFCVSPIHTANHLCGFRNTHTWLNTRWIQREFYKREKQFVKGIITLGRSDSLSYTRELLNRLNHNDILCVAADGGLGHKFISVEFLGGTRRFSTGMVSLARLSGATILPMFCVRGHGEESLLIIESPIVVAANRGTEASLEIAIRHYASLFESYIRMYPGLYRDWQLSDA
jgi:lauroyl/myristoyl acyltransferase